MTAADTMTGVLKWRLRETMDQHGVTRYALQKDTGIAMNTIRALYDGETQRPDLVLLDRVIVALRRLTGQELGLDDVLEFTPHNGD